MKSNDVDLNSFLPAETLAAGYRAQGLVGGPEFVTGYAWLPRLDFRKLPPAVAEKLVASKFPYLIQIQDRPAVPAYEGDVQEKQDQLLPHRKGKNPK